MWVSGLDFPPPHFGSPSPPLCPSPSSLHTSRGKGGARGRAKEDSGWAGLPFQRVIRSRSQSMDAMGLSGKRQNTVTTSHSGSFGHHSPDIAKATGLVSAPHPSRLPASPPAQGPPQGPLPRTSLHSPLNPSAPSGVTPPPQQGWRWITGRVDRGGVGVQEQRPIYLPCSSPARGTSLGCSGPERPLGGSLAPA